MLPTVPWNHLPQPLQGLYISPASCQRAAAAHALMAQFTATTSLWGPESWVIRRRCLTDAPAHISRAQKPVPPFLNFIYTIIMNLLLWDDL